MIDTLGQPFARRLARSLAIAIAIGMTVFSAILGFSIYSFEVGEQCSEEPLRLVEQSLVAFAFAAPIGIALALVIGRKLVHATTDRLDEVIAGAARMTGANLAERLPLSPANDALDRLSHALNDLLDRVESGVVAQRRFAADASHELRTPLAVISTNLEVARRKPREAGHWEGVADDTLAEVRRMTELVEKLLELSRAGAAGLELREHDLVQLAQTAIARAAPLAAERGHALVLERRGDASRAHVDAHAIGIVLDNLVRNALAHAPNDTAITVVVGPGASLAVADRGPGVPPAMRERIFEPFARGVHAATDRAAGAGLGLGLAICHRIIDGHRGTIVARDRDDGEAGAVFAITLPA